MDWLNRGYSTRWISARFRWASRSFTQSWSRWSTTSDECGLEIWSWLEWIKSVVVLLPGDLRAVFAASLSLMTVQKAKHLPFLFWMVPNGDLLSLSLTDTLYQFLFLVSDLWPSLFHEATQWIKAFQFLVVTLESCFLDFVQTMSISQVLLLLHTWADSFR